MKMHEASRFMKSLHRTPEVNLSNAVMTGKFKNKLLSEKERMLLRRRIADIDEDLQKALESQAEAEGVAQRYLDAQPPRNRSEDKLPRHLLDRLEKARALPKRLEHERKTLEDAIKESLLAEEIARQEKGERKAVEFVAKSKKFIESIGERPDTVDQVITLAQSLNGKSLESAFMPFLRAKHTLEDLETEKRHISESFNVSVDDLPSTPDLSYTDDLRASVEKLLGKKLEVKRSQNWRRIWADQRAKDRDAAARRLGIK